MVIARTIAAEETHPLRIAVLRPGSPPQDVIFPGDEDERTIHAGAFVGDRLVAIGSLYLEPRLDEHDASSTWRLRGMATAPDARRMGAGTAALERCIAHAREHGATLLWCNARTPAVAFYEAAGWHVLGEEFDIPTVGPHFVMELALHP